MLFIFWTSCVAALGGLLFGYDTAVIAGTIEYIQPYFHLSDLALGWTVSCALLGSMAGAGGAGWFGDRFGRKKAMLACAVLFLVSAVWSGLAGSANELVFARILGGVGIGAASLLTPVYISEIAPARLRGALTTLNQMALLIGMVVVYLVNAQLAHSGDEAWRLNSAWRWMFASGSFPALLYLVLLFGIPESPRWLVLKNRGDDAARVLEKLGGDKPEEEEMADIRGSFGGSAFSWRELLVAPYRKILLVGAALAVSSQLCGINVVMYYAPRIFTNAGVGTSAAIGHSVYIGLAMLVFTLVALVLADRVGRRPLLLVSSGGMALSLAALGRIFGRVGQGGEFAILALIILYVGFFSIAMGPLVWTMVSEIFPNRIRGRAVGICVLLLWFANYVVSQFFPFLLAGFGSSVFWIYAAASFLAFVFILVFVPETKGKSLEQIESVWSS